MCNHNKSNHALETLGGNNGNVAIIVAICLVALILFTALVVDVGSLYEERRSLQTVADAASLAGVQELPESPDGAIQKAIEYAAKHGVTIAGSDVNISFTWAINDTITVTPVIPNSPLYFARVIGMDSAPVRARAKAIIASPEDYTGTVPWGVPMAGWQPGVEYVLKFGSGPDGVNYCGNFQPLAIDKSGGREYRDNIVYGASTPLKVGDIIDTQPGNQVGNTRQGTETRVLDQPDFSMNDFLSLAGPWGAGYKLDVPDSQFVMVPIIPELVDFTGKEHIEILGFVPFIITSIEDMKGDTEFGNGIAILGTFLNKALIVTKGSIVPVTSQGIRVIRLIE
jgi:hypothetical protein